jgi:hypothetical protein
VSPPRDYRHTQRGPVGLLLWVVAAAFGTAVIFAPPSFTTLAWILAGVLGIVGFCFHTLSVRVDAETLAIAFGPLPLLRKVVRVDQITSAHPGRTTIFDGFGLHWRPGRGWLWNLWGFDCVELTLEGGRKFRIGSDDAQRLAQTLTERSAVNVDSSPNA